MPKFCPSLVVVSVSYGEILSRIFKIFIRIFKDLFKDLNQDPQRSLKDPCISLQKKGKDLKRILRIFKDPKKVLEYL